MWVFWVLFFVVAIVLIVGMVRTERRRLESHVKECQVVAAKMGISFEYDVPDALVSKVKGFDLTYSDGDRLPQAVRDVFSQRSPEEDLYVFLHEHHSDKAGGVGGWWHRETVACLVSPRLQLSRFRLSPERAVERVASMFGILDVDFDSHPGFSRSYFLNAKDEAAIRSLFDWKVLTFFENHPGFHVEGNGDTLIIYQFNKPITLKELPHFLKIVNEIADLFRI